MKTTGAREDINRLSREIAAFPDRAKVAARQGFQIVSGLSVTDRTKVVDLMFSSFEWGDRSIDAEQVSKEIPSLTGRDVGRVMSALSISFALLTQNVVTADEFVQAARGDLFDANSEPTASEIADIVISRRAILEKVMARNRLANEVVPSLTQFDVTVDLRIRFDNGKAQEFVPVALIYIGTDAKNNEFWCQLSRSEMTMLLNKLDNAAREMGLAEELLKRAISQDQ